MSEVLDLINEISTSKIPNDWKVAFNGLAMKIADANEKKEKLYERNRQLEKQNEELKVYKKVFEVYEKYSKDSSNNKTKEFSEGVVMTYNRIKEQSEWNKLSLKVGRMN